MRRRAALFVVVSFCLAPPAAAAGPPDPARGAVVDRLLDDLSAVHRFVETAISPDGSRVAWVEDLRDREKLRAPAKAVYVADLGAARPAPRRITAGPAAGPRDEHGIAWSPDGRRLAFLSDRDRPGQLQLYVAEAGAAPARRLTGLRGALAEPRFSPDGRSIALLVIEGSTRAAGPLGPGAPAVGEIRETAEAQRIAVVDVGTGRVRLVSPPILYIYEYDWSPDGRRFAATAAYGSGPNNWYIAELFVIEADGGRARSILRPAMQIGMPRFSPDGAAVAFIGGLMSDEVVIGGEIFVVPAEGGEPRNLTPGLRASATWLAWLPSPDRILFTEHIEGESGIAAVVPADGPIEQVWRGAETITAGGGFSIGLSSSADGTTTSLIRHSFARPPEVWAGPVGGWRQVTRANAAVRPSWGEARSLRWVSGRFEIQGWLVAPPRPEPGTRSPLIVRVHGGPVSAVIPGWPAPGSPLALAAAGYYVLSPNPRGSLGRSEAFVRAVARDFGYGDLDDILAGVDEAVRAAPIDPERVGITGGSYGGFMTMWAVTRTARFRAAVAVAGIANWQSYYGQNGIDQWMIPFFGASVYDDPKIYARSSPIHFVKNVTTPTLMLVGERDVECPPPQSFEFYKALKTLGVKTGLVVYPEEGHRIADPGRRRDLVRRTVAWFDAHLR